MRLRGGREMALESPDEPLVGVASGQIDVDGLLHRWIANARGYPHGAF